MKLKVTSVMVDDQDKALRFYTEQLGFKKMADIPLRPTYHWLTVTAPEGIAGVELALEPMGFEPARGVVFRDTPTNMGPIRAVMFEDGCGNLIHLVQPVTA